MGGIGIIKMIDGGTGYEGTLPALTVEDVKDKKIIIFFGGTNDRPNALIGERTDLYPNESTVYGLTNYAIESIYALLQSANNLDCIVCGVTPFCQGYSKSVGMGDAFTEMPSGSGQVERDFVDAQVEAYKYKGVPVYDAYTNSGINQYTWGLYGASAADHLHLNKSYGYPKLGKGIAEFISRLIS